LSPDTRRLHDAGLSHDGYVIARGFLCAEKTRALQELAMWAYQEVDTGRAPATIQADVKGWGGLGLPLLAGLGIPKGRMAELGTMIEAAAEPIIGPCRLIPALCLFRRHVYADTLLPWHIDADGAGTKDYDPCLNLWLPLVSVGEGRRPSLEIIPGSHHVMRDEAELPADYAVRPSDWIDRRFASSERVIPTLEPGDALVFDHYLLHRSQPMARVDGPRVSGEFRVTLRADYLSPELDRDLQQAQNEVERLTLERNFYSKKASALEQENRELTESATKYSMHAQKLERELTEMATKYSLWGQKLERELNRIDPDGAPGRRFEAKGEE
jgi:Phytanoyl-CoA dioxygenase (PhyH)